MWQGLECPYFILGKCDSLLGAIVDNELDEVVRSLLLPSQASLKSLVYR